MTYAWINLGDGRQVYRRIEQERGRRSNLPAPMVIGDHMSAVEHPCDGKLYESKSAFRRVTKANGCVEVGNDPQRLKKFSPPKPDRKAIRAAVKMAANRVKNG
jgi:hypothetical protein